jgi:hemerythrin-like domain-containing protein
MFLKPSQILSEELDLISTMLDILTVMQQRMKNNEGVKHEDLKKIVNFIKIYVHECHNKKEKEVLFPELEKKHNAENESILKDIKNENKLTEFYISLLEKLIKEKESGQKSAEKKLITLMEKYIKLEKRHIQKEQFYVVPLCKQEIAEKNKEKLTNAFHECDDQTFGRGMHEKFHEAFDRIVHEMEKQYQATN